LKGGKEGEYLTDRLTDEAIAFIKDHRERPFIVYLSHYAVHTPLQAPRELIQKYQSRTRGTGIDPVYAAMVDRVDTNTGRLLDALDRWDLAENTVVIFASDNGGLAKVTNNRPYRLGKGYLYEGGIRVPLIIRWPGHVEPGTVSATPTISEDIFSTILDIAAVKFPTGKIIDGRSLVPDFSFEGPAPDSVPLHWYYPHYSPQAKRPAAAIRYGSYKLIEFYDPPTVEMYDLKADIGETNNISESFPDLRDKLLDRLHTWLDQTEPIYHTPNPAFSAE
jgi:arylsulfatase A-like enzyme